MARDEPGRDAHRAAVKTRPRKVPKRSNVFDSILTSKLPGTTFAPATVPKRKPKPVPSKKEPFDFKKSATELRSYQDLVEKGRKEFMAEVPYTKRVSRDPGPTLAQWMATHKGDPTAQTTYVQLRRQRDFTEAENAKWRKQRAQEWEDVLSGKAEREQKAAFHSQFGAEEIDPMPKALWERQPWRKEKDESYNAYRERLKAQKRTKVQGMYEEMLKDPEGWYEREGRKPHDVVGKVSQAGIGGLEWFGLPKSVGNDLRLISSGFIPGIIESGSAVFAAAKGDPTKIAAIINQTVDQYRENYLANDAGKYAAKHPVLFGLDAAIVLGPIAKLSSVLLLSRSLRLANPGMTTYTANRLAVRESSRPGYAATKGIEGGVPERNITTTNEAGEEVKVGRPVSRSAPGRVSQGIYDWGSQKLDLAGPKTPLGRLAALPGVKHLTTTSRAAAAIAKDTRRRNAQIEAIMAAVNDPIAHYTTASQRRRTRRLIGRVIADKPRAALLIAALEAGTDVKKAATERIAALTEVLDQGILWDRPDMTSPERDQFVQTLNENPNLSPDEVEQAVKLSDSMARAQNPKNPADWYRTHLAESSNMSAQDFLESGAAAAAQFQLTHGLRKGLTDTGQRRDIDPDDIDATLTDVGKEARTTGIGGIFWKNKDGTSGELEPIFDLGFDKPAQAWQKFDHQTRHHTTLTPEEASAFLKQQDQPFLYSGDFFSWETPVFYSPLQREIAAMPTKVVERYGSQVEVFAKNNKPVSAEKLEAELRKAVGNEQFEQMGMEAFFRQYSGDPEVTVPKQDLLDHLGDALNAYNLDEVVRSSLVSEYIGPYDEPNPDRVKYASSEWDYSITSRIPDSNAPYYELTMSLGDMHPRQTDRPYSGSASIHWGGNTQENILVHIRFHIIWTPDGKRAMLIDEIQSDWANDWRKAGSPEWGVMRPEDRARLDVINEELRKLNEEKQTLVSQTDVAAARNARRDMQTRINRADDMMNLTASRARTGGNYEPLPDLRDTPEYQEMQAEVARLGEEALRLEQEYERVRGTWQAIRESEIDLTIERSNIHGRYEQLPPPLGGKEINAAVRRASRWAAEADVDRIIIVPGEVQTIRYASVNTLPDGTKIDLSEEHSKRDWAGYQKDVDAWKASALHLMDKDQLLAYVKRNVDEEKRLVAERKAMPKERAEHLRPVHSSGRTYERIYEQDIPRMFEKELGVKSEMMEDAYYGYHADMFGKLTDREHSNKRGTVIEMTPEAKAHALKPMRLFQRTPDFDGLPRGATEWLEDGRSAMRLFEGAGIDTVIHELAHIAMPDLDPESQATLSHFFGGPPESWTQQQKEAFARGFEHYLYSGEAPTLELQVAFGKIRAWITAVWLKMKQDPAKYAMSPEVNEVFERMVLPKDRSPLTPEERNRVEAQIADLYEALENPGDMKDLAAAQEAVYRMSQWVEDVGREIMLYGFDEEPDPDTGISELEIMTDEIDAMLERRRHAYTDLLTQMGIIDPTDQSTRAAGYFPNLSTWRIGGQVPIEATKMPATGSVLGVPRPRPDALNMKRNQFIRFQTGELLMNPSVLYDVLRMRIKHLGTLKARERLYNQGDLITKEVDIEGLDEGLMLIRNPKAEARKIQLQTHAALGMDEDSYTALVERGQDPSGRLDAQSIDPTETAAQAMDEGVWWKGKEGPEPEWVRSEKDVRTVSRHVAEKIFGEVFTSAPRGGVVGPTANALARMTMLYAPALGTRYMVRNFLQNAVLLGVTHPTSLRHAVKAVRMLNDPDNRELANMIDADTGSTRAEAALPEYYLKAQTRAQKRSKEITELQKSLASGLSKVADDPFRRSAWIGYAERYGFNGPEGWRRLLTSEEPAVQRTRRLISQAVRDDLIDFDAMSAKERRFASHYFFLYPFVRGSLKWPFMFMREYPTRAGIGGAYFAQQGQQREQDLLAKTTSEAGRTRLAPGKKQYEFGWLDPISPAAQTIEGLTAAVQGIPKMDFAAISQMLSPEYRVAIQALSGTASKSRPWQSLLSSFLPGFSSYEKARRGGSLSDQLLRHMGLSVEPSPSRMIQRKQAKAELIDAWQWAISVGEELDSDDMKEIGRSTTAYEKYQDLDQRIDFSQKDLGEGSLRADDLTDAQKLEREQQKAVALTIAYSAGWPEQTEQMTRELKQVRNADIVTLKAYNEGMTKLAFGARNSLINAYKRAHD